MAEKTAAVVVKRVKSRPVKAADAEAPPAGQIVPGAMSVTFQEGSDDEVSPPTRKKGYGALYLGAQGKWRPEIRG